MNIVHIGLSCHYTEGMTYQDNIIPDINCKDGHRVSYISDTFRFEGGKLVKVQVEDKVLPSSLRLIRLNLDKVINEKISRKIIKCKKLEDVLEDLQPEVILYHNLVGYALMTVTDYVKKHPSVIFYADCHLNFGNTARSFPARLFYKYVHGHFIRKTLPYINKVFYLSMYEKKYLQNLYHVSENQLEWLPLGGIVYELKQKDIYKKQLIKYLGLQEECIVFGHSGKLDKGKRTAELVRAFVHSNVENSALVIFGSIPEENRQELMSLIQSDSRIFYLGWKNSDEIFKLLLAIDLYCQPGTCSATLQNAICCGCAVMVYPYEAYKQLIDGNGIFVETESDMKDAFLHISQQKDELNRMKENSHRIADAYLDYEKIAARLYHD